MSEGASGSGRLQAGSGLILMLGISVLALASLVWTPHSLAPANAIAPLVEPGTIHWLGSDGSGRDLFSALMAGTLTTLLLGGLSTLISLLVGISLGAALAARFGASPRRLHAIAGIVPIALAIGLVCSALRLPPALVILLAVGLPGAMMVALVARSAIAPVLQADFVSAARLAGLGWLAAAQRHIVPLVLPRLAALGLELLATAMLIEATLSFAGLGVDSPSISLGTLLRDGQQLAQMRPLLVIAPGVVLVVAGLSLLLAAGGLRKGRDNATV